MQQWVRRLPWAGERLVYNNVYPGLVRDLNITMRCLPWADKRLEYEREVIYLRRCLW